MKAMSEKYAKQVRVAGVILCDTFIIHIVSLLSLWIRFELSYSGIPKEYLRSMIRYAPIYTVVTILVFTVFHLYTSLWRYASIYELIYLAIAVFCNGLLLVLGTFAWNCKMPRSYYILCMILNAILLAGVRMGYRFLRILKNRVRQRGGNKIMIIGAGDAGRLILDEILTSKYLEGTVVCFIDDDRMKQGKAIHGIKVVGGRRDIPRFVDKFGITQIIVAIPSADAAERRDVLNICRQTDCKLRILPGIYQMVNGQVSLSKLRDVKIEDLLERDPVKVDLDKITGYVKGKVVLVTGGGGSIGSELCRQIANYQPKQLVILDIYENNVYDIQQELMRRHPELNLEVVIGSVRSNRRMHWLFQKYHPQLVYHAAAHKHVPLMEESPHEAIKNNTIGTYKTALMAAKYGAKKFVLISTDKAVNPTNIMGASKRLCEMIVQCMDRKFQGTDFVAVRFGNVLGSNGSVIPLFKKQIEEGGPVTVTHPKIIRYFMTIPEAAALVLQAGGYARGGEIFVLDMGEPVKILDLAKNLITLSGYTPGVDMEIKITGLRPGEKLYEEMLMEEEGLQDTENHRIHIGKPIPMDDQWFLTKLDELDEASYHEDVDIRMLVKELVPEYHYQNESVRRAEDQMQEVAASKE